MRTRFEGTTSDDVSPGLSGAGSVGAAILGDTDGFVRFDTGVVAGPTFTSGSRLIDLTPSVEFTISPGDAVHLRGLYTIDTAESGLVTPEQVFPILSALSAVPEPSSTMLLFAAGPVLLLTVSPRQRRHF